MVDTPIQHCVRVWYSAKGEAYRGSRECVPITEVSHFLASLVKSTQQTMIKIDKNRLLKALVMNLVIDSLSRTIINDEKGGSSIQNLTFIQFSS